MNKLKKIKEFEECERKVVFPVDFEVSRNDPRRRKFETKTLLLGVMQNPNSESGLHVYNQRSRVGFGAQTLQITYLVNFFETLEKQLFMGNENEEEDVFFFLLLFIHNGFYHALIPLYCFEDPFHLHYLHFLTEMDYFAWTHCTEFMRN